MSFTRPNLHGQGGPNMAEVLEKMIDAKLAPMESRIMAKLNIIQQQIMQCPQSSGTVSLNEYSGKAIRSCSPTPLEAIPMPPMQPIMSVGKHESSKEELIRDLLEERLKPLVTVSEKIDKIAKSEKENSLRTTIALESLGKRLDDLDEKTSDIKDDWKETLEQTEKIITKVAKIHDAVSRLPYSKDLDQFDKTVVTLKELNLPKLLSEDFALSMNSMRKAIQGLTILQTKSLSKESKRSNKELSDDDDVETNIKRGRSNSIENRDKKRHRNGKKSRRSSSSSSSDSDEDSDEKSRKSFNNNNPTKYLAKVLNVVDELDGRIESWIKSSKKALHKSDETTNCILAQMLANNKALESLISKQRLLECQISDLKSGSNSCEDSTKVIVENVTVALDKLETCAVAMEALQKDQKVHFQNLSTDMMNITDRTTKLNKLEEINSKCNPIFQIQSNQELILAKLDDIPATINEEDKANRDLTIILRDLIPRMDDFYTKVLPILDDLKKLQRQAVDHDELQEKQNNANLQKILFHLEEIANKSIKPADPRTSLPTDTTVLQVFNAINDIKTRDLANTRILTELQGECQKSTTRLNEMLKHKSKTQSILEELVQSGETNTKTLATINTNVQAMRTSSSGYDAKFVGYFREIRQIVTEAKTPLGNIDDNTSKLLSAIDQEDFVLSGKHLKSVQQSVNDLKSEMKKYFEVQKTKNIPETFQNGSSQANYKINNATDSSLSELSSVPKELMKLSSVSAEILNSVEDMKQLTSSVPHTVHDLMPRIEKIATIVTNLPNEVLSYTAALEENLGKNLEKCMKDIMKGSLGEIFSKFDLIDQRMAVIKKYAKYGGGNNVKAMQSGIGLAKFLESDGDTFSKSSSIHESDIASDDVTQCIVKHISDECRILGDSIAKTMDQFIAAADTAGVCQTVSDLNSANTDILKQILENQKTITKEQAKALEVEEHIDSIVATILRPIQGLLPLQEELVKAVKGEINRLKSDYKRPILVASQMQDTLSELLNATRGNNSLLTDLKRFFHFSSDDRLSDVLRSKVEASLEKSYDDPSVFQAEAVKNLLEFMIRVQATQHDILKNSDKSVEYQTALNEAFSQLIPLMEVIHSVLQQRKRQKLHSADIEDLCNELRLKIATLADLESNLLQLKNNRCVDDLRISMELCNNVLQKLVVESRSLVEDNSNPKSNSTGMDPSESDLDLSEKQEETSSTPQPLKSRLLPKKRRMSYLSEDDQPLEPIDDPHITDTLTTSDSPPSCISLRRLPSAGERKSFSKRALLSQSGNLDSEGSALETSSNADSPLNIYLEPESDASKLTESGPQKLLVHDEIIKRSNYQPIVKLKKLPS